jgi:hypothetical protein
MAPVASSSSAPGIADLLQLIQQKQAAVAALNSRRASAETHMKRAREDGVVDTADVFGTGSMEYQQEYPASEPSRRKAGRKPGPRAAKVKSEDEEEEMDEEQPVKLSKNGRPAPQSEKKRREQNRAAQKVCTSEARLNSRGTRLKSRGTRLKSRGTRRMRPREAKRESYSSKARGSSYLRSESPYLFSRSKRPFYFREARHLVSLRGLLFSNSHPHLLTSLRSFPGLERTQGTAPEGTRGKGAAVREPGQCTGAAV